MTDYGLVVALIAIVVIGTLSALSGSVADPFVGVDSALNGSGGSIDSGGGAPSTEPTPTPEPQTGSLLDQGTGGQGQTFDNRTYRISEIFDPAGGSELNWTFDGTWNPPGSVMTGVRCDQANYNDDATPTATSSHSLALPDAAIDCYLYLWHPDGYSFVRDNFTAGNGTFNYLIGADPLVLVNRMWDSQTTPSAASGGFDSYTYRITSVFDPQTGTPVTWNFATPTDPSAGTITGLRCDGVSVDAAGVVSGSSAHSVTAPLSSDACYVFLRSDVEGWSEFGTWRAYASSYDYTVDPIPAPVPTADQTLLDQSSGAQGQSFDNRTYRISPVFDPQGDTAVLWTFAGPWTPATSSTTGVRCDGTNYNDSITPTATSSHWLVVPGDATSCFVYLWNNGGYSHFYGYVAGNGAFGYTTGADPAP